MTTWRALDADGRAEQVLVLRDDSCGLEAILVVDNTRLGPAAGGIRTASYPSFHDALEDAHKLARAMTYKNALAGLDAGGAKCVVIQRPQLDRLAGFRRLGAAIQSLGGRFRTAGDFGTTQVDLDVLASVCEYVHADSIDLAAAVGRSVAVCLSACAAYRKRPMSGLTVAIQGCGDMGAAVAQELSSRGAALRLADLSEEVVERVARTTGGTIVAPSDVFGLDVDAVAPCARGGVITGKVVDTLTAWCLCGAANNSMASDDIAARIQRKGVLWVPDVLSSAGAVIMGIGRTVMGLDDPGGLIDALGPTTTEVLAASEAEGRSTQAIACERARARLAV